MNATNVCAIAAGIKLDWHMLSSSESHVVVFPFKLRPHSIFDNNDWLHLSASKMILFPKCYTFPKFSNKTHCCLHWLLRSGKLSHRSVSVCNFLFANKSRSNLATKTKTIFYIRIELYFTPNKISYTCSTQCATHINCVGGGFEHNTASLVMILMSWLSDSG